MDTAHKNDDQKKETFDSEELLDQKCQLVADLIRNSNHFIAFTGAGISTSCGIPDFRSGKDTVLKTGPGAWEKRALNLPNDKKHVSVSSLQAIPSYTHMALLTLEKYSLLKFLISQNTDGLHRRSAFPPQKLAELHGNTNMEVCTKCGKQYMRDYRTRTAKGVFEHLTGRKCDNPTCRGELKDTIINFKENLPEKPLDDGFLHAQMSDLCICFGSSLTVSPANQMPKTMAKQGGKLIIVNLQPTPLDSDAFLRINGLCDKVMEKIMKNLEIDVPQFMLQRYFSIQLNNSQKGDSITISGEDSEGSPYELFRSVKITNKDKTDSKTLTEQPYNIKLVKSKIEGKKFESINLKLNFFQHYQEPAFEMLFDFDIFEQNEKKVYRIDYDPKKQQWVNFEEYKDQFY